MVRKLTLLLFGLAFGVCVIGLVALMLVVTVALLVYAAPHGLQHYLGIDTQSSYNYDFVSGVGPMIVALLSYSGILLIVWHHLNCHQDGCFRIGRYQVAGGRFRTCRGHHPDPAIQQGVQAHHLLEAHRAHQQQ